MLGIFDMDEFDKEGHEAVGAYASGEYVCKCNTCKKDFMGDKRASSCYRCAVDFKQSSEAKTISKESSSAKVGRVFNYLYRAVLVPKSANITVALLNQESISTNVIGNISLITPIATPDDYVTIVNYIKDQCEKRDSVEYDVDLITLTYIPSVDF